MPISVDLPQGPSSCFQPSAPRCDPVGDCTFPTGFCANINTQNETAIVYFKGVEQGYYWLIFNANLGNGATRGSITSIDVINPTPYFVTAKITSELATLQIGISNSSSS